MKVAAARRAPSLIDRLIAGERLALARTISLIEAGGEPARRIQKELSPRSGRAEVVGFTGPPGAGKSTLIDAYIAELRAKGRTVAVAAVDPSSPISGGAVLGDRVRMGRHSADAGVFIRSLASRGHLGGLTRDIHRIVDAMDVAGYDVIVVETVGAGQSEVEVVDVADVRVVVNAPGLGDDVQAIKAGILEIADILVVNKADLPLAERTMRQLEGMLKLRSAERQATPVLATVATEGRGVAELAEAIGQWAGAVDRAARRTSRMTRLLAQTTAQAAARQVFAEAERLAPLIEALTRGDIDLEEAAQKVLASLAPIPSPRVRGEG